MNAEINSASVNDINAPVSGAKARKSEAAQFYQYLNFLGLLLKVILRHSASLLTLAPFTSIFIIASDPKYSEAIAWPVFLGLEFCLKSGPEKNTLQAAEK